MQRLAPAAIINGVSGQPITGGAKCPSCYNPIQPGWQWCHSCGYDPEGLNPDGDGPSPPPKGAPKPPPEPAEPELFGSTKPLLTSDLAAIADPVPVPPFESVRAGPPDSEGAGGHAESFGPSGGGSAQTGPYAPPELHRPTVRERILSPVGIVFAVLLLICVVIAILFLVGGFNDTGLGR